MLGIGVDVWRGVYRGASSPNATNRTVVFEGDSITASSSPVSYARLYEFNAAPQFTSFNVSAVAGSRITDVVNRVSANNAKKVLPGSNIYWLQIGANDTTDSAWLISVAAHLDVMRAAGWYVVIGTVLPKNSTPWNTGRATVNAEIRLWTTGGSTAPGIHADAVCDFDTTSMGLDATGFDTNYYSDGLHPTAAGHVILEAKMRSIINAATSTGVTAAPQMSVASGIYGVSQSVTLTSATSGAAIYYTLDSSDPTTASTLYSGAINVTTSTTIRALAVKSGLSNSACTDGIYTFGTAPDTTSLEVWCKYNAGINNTATGVARWEDRLKGRHLVQDTTSKRPSVSSGIITFDGSNDCLRRVLSLPQPCTVYALMRQDAWGGGNKCLIGGADNGGGLYQNPSSPSVSVYGGSFAPQTSQATVGTFVALCFVLNGASSSIRVNNNAAITGDAGSSQSMNGVTLGALNNGLAQFSNLSIKELTVYSVAHNSTQQDAEITRLLAI